MSRVKTHLAALLALGALAATNPAVATLPDDDRDNVADSAELLICGTALLSEDVLGALSPYAGQCATATDYRGPTVQPGVSLPSGWEFGADLDGDAFPATLTIKRTVYRTNPFTSEIVWQSEGTPLTITGDPDDANPNIPIASVAEIPFPITYGYVLGPHDTDGDLVPAALTLKRMHVTLDRRDPALVQTRPGPDVPQVLDHADDDPDVPVKSIIIMPASAPHDYTFSEDADHDGFPRQVALHFEQYTWDRRNPAHVKATPAPDYTRVLDGNEADPDVPVPSALEFPAPIYRLEPGADADADNFPSTLSVVQTTFTYDRRDPLNLKPSSRTLLSVSPDSDDNDKETPLQATYPFRVPIAAEFGPDTDGDRVPGTLVITYLNVTLDRTDPSPQQETTTEILDLDPDDDTRGAREVPIDPFDRDRDDIPDAAEPTICRAQNVNFPEDGTCLTPTDYVAPVEVPNPWRRS